MRRPAGHLYRRRAGRRFPLTIEGGGTIWLRYTVKGQTKAVSLHTEDPAMAEARAAEILAKAVASDEKAYLQGLVDLGEWAKTRLGNGQTSGPTIAAAWAAYSGSRRRRPITEKTLANLAYRWQRFAKWAPASLALPAVTTAMAESYAQDLDGAGMNADTVNSHLKALRQVWALLCPASNPWAGLQSARPSSPTHYRRLSPPEVSRLFAAASGEYRGLLAVAYYTGLRLHDAATLRHDQYDAARKVLSLRPAKTARFRSDPLEIPVLFDFPPPAPDGNPHLFPSIAALYQRDPAAVSKRIARIFLAAGVADSAAGKASFHSFRVTWQSMADDHGVPRQIARAVLGHTGPAMSDTYSRMAAEVVRKELLRMFAGNPPATPGPA